MPQYTVSIDLDSSTLTALKNGGFSMHAFKGVKTSSPGSSALPTLWFQQDRFSSTVDISWADTFGGYFSATDIKENAVVKISTEDLMNLGDILTLQENGGSAKTSGGVSTAYNFKSDKTETWTCGLTTSAKGGEATPICAFPQYGAVANVLMPYDKVLLLFTQEQQDTGSVLQTAVSSSISIIMSPQVPDIGVAFDINTGWNTRSQPQAVSNPVNFDMAPDLIVPLSSTVSGLLAM